MTAIITTITYAVIHLSFIIRILTVNDKDPTSRAAWVLILIFLPVTGIVIYLLFGEPWVARRYMKRINSIGSKFYKPEDISDQALDNVPIRFHTAFHVCEAIAYRNTVTGNQALIAKDSNDAISLMINDFNNAKKTIHISFYIWLTDNNGLKVVNALIKAAKRGVTCRVVADTIGSRALIRSQYWSQMRDAGILLHASLKLSYGLNSLFGNRIDLRNHRKVVVIDNKITYCGSQNCADPEFLIKPKYAPWVDIMLRFEGPVARQNQLLFVSGWMFETGEKILIPNTENNSINHNTNNNDELHADNSSTNHSHNNSKANQIFPAIAFGTGPSIRKGAMSDVFVSLMYSAQQELVISTPYFVPDSAILAALISSARRGIKTILILPARNDSMLVAIISKAQYSTLIKAGVKVFEFHGGLLHAKTLVVDKEVSLIGSANMDRRSLELNFENNILLHSIEVTKEIRNRQDYYLSNCTEVTLDDLEKRNVLHKLIGNTITIVGPVL